MTKIMTPKELLKKLQERAIIEPIIDKLSEKIMEELFNKFTVELLEKYERVSINCTINHKCSITDARVLKDKILTELDEKFRKSQWLFTKYALSINTSGPDVEASFTTQCEPVVSP